MTPENFAYWLQGYFEILDAEPDGEELSILSGVQIDVIQKHIELVRLTDKDNYFVNNIDLLLEEGVSTSIIKKSVSLYFKHVVDPKHPMPTKADKIHGPGLVRC